MTHPRCQPAAGHRPVQHHCGGDAARDQQHPAHRSVVSAGSVRLLGWFDFRNLLQLHHVHGGELRGDHHHGPQLSPQDGGHTQHARLGQESLPPVAALAASHVKVQFGRGRG